MTSIHYPYKRTEIDRFLAKYQLGRTLLDRGLNAVATGYEKETFKTVVIKAVVKRPDQIKLKEANILRKLNKAPGIVEYMDDYNIKSDLHFVVMRQFGHTNLKKYLSKNGDLSEKISHKVMVQIIAAVQECKNFKIVHTQIRPSNILVDLRSFTVKLTNFNTATYIVPEGYSAKIRKISPDLAPPEYYTWKHYTSEGQTIWALGLLLYNMLFNCHAFKSAHEVIHQRTLKFTKPVSLEAEIFLEWSLEKHPQERMNFIEMRHHPWITKKNI